MTQPIRTISPMCQRMIEDMVLRQLAPKTQAGYIRVVKHLTRFLSHSPDTATAEDLRCYPLRLVAEGISRVSLNATITALRFFFEITLQRSDAIAKVSRVYAPRKLSVILSAEEITRLIDAAPSLKHCLWPMARVCVPVRWWR